MEWTLSRAGLGMGMAAAGLLLLLSPWLFGFAEEGGARTSAASIGAAMVLVGTAAGLLGKQWADEAALTLGAWALVAPFVLGFVESTAAFSVHLCTGVAAMLLGVAAADWRSRHPPIRPA